METIVKVCGACDEGFAKNVDVCPRCGSRLETFRLEAIDDKTKSASERLPDPAADFAVTVIADSNGAKRNALFAGALALVVTVLASGIVFNLFSKELDLGSINDDIFNAVLVDDVAEPIENEPKAKNDDGGGGGDHNPVPASQGDRAPMRVDPKFAPSVSMDRLSNPTIPIQMAIKGTINERIDTSRYGVKLGGDAPSDGPGANGGQGPGRNGGQGPDDGPGAGPGNRGGIAGIPNNLKDDEDPPPGRGGVTIALKIINKPRPSYTDEARQSGIQGDVILRVSFLSNGTIGKIDVVKGLGGGLTERAIQSARKITFEPVILNGRPQTVTKQIEYGFYIY